MDWVVSPVSYDLRLTSYSFDPSNDPDGDGTRGDHITVPLTSHADIVDPTLSTWTPQLEHTVLRTRGTIYYYLPTQDPVNPPTMLCELWVHFRIVVISQHIGIPNPIQETSTQYDMRLATTANDDFLWEYTDMCQLQSSFWSDTNLYPTWARNAMKVDVDVRVKRRLKQRQVLALRMGAHLRQKKAVNGGLQAIQWPDDSIIAIEPVFRTLIQTAT